MSFSLGVLSTMKFNYVYIIIGAICAAIQLLTKPKFHYGPPPVTKLKKARVQLTIGVIIAMVWPVYLALTCYGFIMEKRLRAH